MTTTPPSDSYSYQEIDGYHEYCSGVAFTLSMFVRVYLVQTYPYESALLLYTYNYLSDIDYPFPGNPIYGGSGESSINIPVITIPSFVSGAFIQDPMKVRMNNKLRMSVTLNITNHGLYTDTTNYIGVITPQYSQSNNGPILGAVKISSYSTNAWYIKVNPHIQWSGTFYPEYGWHRINVKYGLFCGSSNMYLSTTYVPGVDIGLRVKKNSGIAKVACLSPGSDYDVYETSQSMCDQIIRISKNNTIYDVCAYGNSSSDFGTSGYIEKMPRIRATGKLLYMQEYDI
jgi:hypothetical protein